MDDRIVPPLLETYERLAKEWNNAEESALMWWVKLFADRLERNEPTNGTLLESMAQVALKMVNTLPREELEALLGR